MSEMFCFQCEQAAQGVGCSKLGVCGKTPEVAALQNLIVRGLLGMGFWAHHARQKGAIDRDIDVHMIEALFTTVTNVDFDPDSCEAVARKTVALRNQVFEKANGGPYPGDIPEAATGKISTKSLLNSPVQSFSIPIVFNVPGTSTKIGYLPGDG